MSRKEKPHGSLKAALGAICRPAERLGECMGAISLLYKSSIIDHC